VSCTTLNTALDQTPALLHVHGRTQTADSISPEGLKSHTIEKKESVGRKFLGGFQGLSPGRSGGRSPPAAVTLLLNQHALFNAPLRKIVKFEAHI